MFGFLSRFGPYHLKDVASYWALLGETLRKSAAALLVLRSSEYQNDTKRQEGK